MMMDSPKWNRFSNYVIAFIFFVIGSGLLLFSLLAIGGICGPYLSPIQGILCVFGAIVFFVCGILIVAHTGKKR
jgi:hypothetical protein